MLGEGVGEEERGETAMGMQYIREKKAAKEEKSRPRSKYL